MGNTDKKYSSSNIENESSIVSLELKDFSIITDLEFLSNRLLKGTISLESKYKYDIIDSHKIININHVPYYDKDNKCINIPIIFEEYDTITHKHNIIIARCPLSRDVIMECIRDCDEAEE